MHNIMLSHTRTTHTPLSPPHTHVLSIFSLATAEELDESLKWWRGKIDDGTADQYLKECEEERLKIGTSVSVVAYKPQ